MIKWPKNETKFETIERWFRIQVRRLKDLVWWIRYRTINRHHVVKISSLKPGWCDVTEKLVHVNFELLKQFVEQEKPFDVIDWNADNVHQHAALEINDLYYWWTKVRPFREQNEPAFKVDPEPTEFVPFHSESGELLYELKYVGTPEQKEAWGNACDKIRELEEQWRQEDIKNIKRLADIKDFLWT